MIEFSAFDRRAMNRALEIAALGRATTQPNPRVGCVIAREGRIIGEGWHRLAGEPHAEAFALEAAGAAARGATAYVTLEPCSHFGRTPPCTDALVRAGIARVLYAIDDPDPRVSGGGAAQLRAAGVEVHAGLLAAEATALNHGFLSRLSRGRPWVRLKLAASLDGRTALSTGESQWITSDASRIDVHHWRAESAAILTTANTVIADDPALTPRTVPPSRRQPLRVVLDSRLRITPAARVFRSAGEVCVFAAADTLRGPDGALRRDALVTAGARVESLPVAAGGRLDLRAALEHLTPLKINEVWVEAGATLAGSLLDLRLADELLLYLAPRFLGPDARPLAGIASLARLADSQEWAVSDLRRVGPDVRIMLRPT